MIDGRPLKVSCGVGVDSVAMLVGMEALGVVPDAILFADTGSEMPETYAYIPTLQSWLVSVGFPPLTTVRNPSPIAGDASLYDECVRKGVLASISYGRHSCADKWKIKPQERWCRSWPLAQQAWADGRKVVVAVGYDAGGRDSKRACKATYRVATTPSKRFSYWYPLQQWGWGREVCEAMIDAAGLPLPVKSSCFFCGARKKPEIDAMRRDHPDLFRMALAMERAAMPRLRTVAGIGRRFAWADLTETGFSE